MSNSKISVTVQIDDHQGEVEIVDSDFHVIERGFGLLKKELAPGIYKVRARAGDVRQEELFVVEPDAAPFDVTLERLRFSSPVPLGYTSTSHEYHQGAVAVALAEPPVDKDLGQGATLVLSLRDPSDVCKIQRDQSVEVREMYRSSFMGFRLRNGQGDLLLDLDQVMRQEPDWGFSIINLHLQPDNYVLSYENDSDGPVAMPLPAFAFWQTQVFIRVDLPKGLNAPGLPNLKDRAVMMAPLGMPFVPNDWFFRLSEISRYALVQGRASLRDEQVNQMLQEKFFNPILGLLAAHVLLLRREPPKELLHIVRDNLAAMIGADNPDIAALGIALTEMDKDLPGSPSQGLSFPPLLRASWDIVGHHPGIVKAGSLMSDVASRLIPQGPWLAWKPVEPATIALAIKAVQRSPVKKMANLVDLIRDIRSDSSDSGNDMIGSVLTAEEPDGIGPHEPEAARPVPDDASTALEAFAGLARKVPWKELFKFFKSGTAGGGMFAQFTELQKSLLPTLQLISVQLEEGDDFTLDDLRQLSEGLKVSLPVLHESAKDLLKIVLYSGMAFLAEKFAEKE